MPNLIASPRKWKNKVLLIKLETAYGVDATPTGAVNWIEARNVSLTPMDNDKVQRNIDLPYLGNAGEIIVSSWTKLAFDVAVAPSGIAGTAPKWGPLMLACGTAETVTATTSAAYNLVSTAFASATAYMNIDGTLHKLMGMRGSVKGKLGAKGIYTLSFSFDANYASPVAAMPGTVVRTGWTIEEGVNSVNTTAASINSIPLAFSELDWDFGNKVGRIDLPGPQREIAITDRTVTTSLTVLAPDLAVFNPFALIESGATVPVSFTHGSALGKKAKTDLQTRVVGCDYTEVEGQAAYKLTLNPVPVVGNDEIALTCL